MSGAYIFGRVALNFHHGVVVQHLCAFKREYLPGKISSGLFPIVGLYLSRRWRV